MGAKITKVADDNTISKKTVEDTLENTVDMIATDLILKENFRDMVNLMNKDKCDELIILTADTLFKNFKNMDISFLKKRFKNIEDTDGEGENKDIPEQVVENTEVSVINKKKFIELDSRSDNSREKYNLCVGIAKYYIQIAHLYAAIATTVNPTYSYSNITGKPQEDSCESEGDNFKIPSDIKVGGTPSPFMISPNEMPAPISPTPDSITPLSVSPSVIPTPTPPPTPTPTPTPGTVQPMTPSPTPGSPSPDANPNVIVPTPQQLPELKISDKLNDLQTDLRGKSSLPQDMVITKTNIKGLCNSRLASLADGMNLEDLDTEATVTINPTFCDMNKTTKLDSNGMPETKTLSDEPGIPELEGLYKDKYDYSKGEYTELSPEMQEQYNKDLKLFYTAFTGNEIMPKNITKFCEIPLREFHNTIGCSSKEAQFSKTDELMGSRVYKAFDGSIMISENGGTGMAQTLNTVEGFTEEFIVGFVKNPPGQLYPQQEIELYEKDPSSGENNIPMVKFTNDYAGAYRKVYTGTLKERLFKKYADHLIKMMQNAETQKKALLDNLRKIFVKNPNPSSERLFVISNKLTSESLSAITDNVRDVIVKMYVDCENDFLVGIKLFDALIDKQILDEAISTKRQLTKTIRDDEDKDAITEFKDMESDVNITREMTPEDIEYYTMLFNRYISENTDGELNPGLTSNELDKFIKELPIDMTKNQKERLFDQLQSDNFVDIESLLEWLNGDEYRSLLAKNRRGNESGSLYVETPYGSQGPTETPALLSGQLKVSDNYRSLFPTVRNKFRNIKFFLYSANTIPEQKGSATLNCCNMDMNITPSPTIVGYSVGYKSPPLFIEHIPGINEDDTEGFRRNKLALEDNVLGINYWFLIKQETNYATDVEAKPSIEQLKDIPPFDKDKEGYVDQHSKRTIKGLDLAVLNPNTKPPYVGGSDDDIDSGDLFDDTFLSPTSDTEKGKRVVLLWWFRNMLETTSLNNVEINPNINKDTTTMDSMNNTNTFIRKLKAGNNYIEL